MAQTVDASPTKEFFVNMITRDISLTDCVLDLLDNSVDGAHATAILKTAPVIAGILPVPEDKLYLGYYTHIHVDQSKFEIEDNCGGISIENAKKYAFHFGRKSGTPATVSKGIGLYGIGMKRAILKMGNNIQVKSSTLDEGFEVKIDVQKWIKRKKWDFPLDEQPVSEPAGTTIQVTGLYPNISVEFVDNSFIVRLIDTIARDYFVFLNRGYKVKVNDSDVSPSIYELRESEAIKPSKLSYLDETGVEVEISAGMVDLPPDSVSAEEIESRARRDPDKYGWFVICNDRVVLAADKTGRTVWGIDGFPIWHPQYNGFMGIVKFSSADPSILPWTTTKRDIDRTNPIYRRALVRMKEATKIWTDYTTLRKNDLASAKALESVAIAKSVERVEVRPSMILPKFEIKPKIKMANIQYQKPETDVDKVRKRLGNLYLPYSEVGRLTFEYYIESEVEE